MEFRHLGRSGLKVSEIAYGNWLTHGSQIEANVATACVRAALDVGITTFDTADVYAQTRAETVLGEALKGERREGLEIFTKVYWPTGPGRNDVGLSRKHIMESCHSSLKRLQTDHIDLYQIHHSDPITPLEETMRALDDLVRQGMVRYIGVSNWEAWKMMKANGIAEHLGLTRIVTNQVYYSLAGRDIEQEMVPVMADQNIGCLVWSPLAGGYMAGKYTPGEGVKAEPGRRAQFDFPPIDKDKADRIVVAMREIAKKQGVSVATVGLSWVRQKPFITSTIIGATTMEQLNDNIASVNFTLPAEDVARLDELSADRTQYPYWMITRNNTTRIPTDKPLTLGVIPKN